MLQAPDGAGQSTFVNEAGHSDERTGCKPTKIREFPDSSISPTRVIPAHSGTFDPTALRRRTVDARQDLVIPRSLMTFVFRTGPLCALAAIAAGSVACDSPTTAPDPTGTAILAVSGEVMRDLRGDAFFEAVRGELVTGPLLSRVLLRRSLAAIR